MTCEYDYCIYCKENKCRLESVSINSIGMCGDCIIVSLEKNFLDEKKEQQLQEMESRF